MTRFFKFIYLCVICLMLVNVSCKTTPKKTSNVKPTICIIGGTPSTTDILTFIPDSLKAKYNFISFNRPGFGGTEYTETNATLLYELAENAGLKTHDYAVIGISGGGPLAMLLASKFKLKYCGVISGMVSKDAYFEFADSAITKDLFTNLLLGYDGFKSAVLKFPNLDQIAKQAGSESEDMFIKASYNDLKYVLSEPLYAAINNAIYMDWWHGENDTNVPFKSAELFLKNYKNATLHIIPNASHDIDSTIYIQKLIDSWEIK
ncbi:alpha/beta fold hydrolase [Confluentibacter lentus]|uniref:alpha/beta fold hydrolase n=1 Tax=Confluentibacter lentus TaxID=1699412 RepID=UPI0012FD82CB|nr:alpha/beta hydrolase [Confluentibacter lentus]